jgi:hypothetical protein
MPALCREGGMSSWPKKMTTWLAQNSPTWPYVLNHNGRSAQAVFTLVVYIYGPHGVQPPSPSVFSWMRPLEVVMTPKKAPTSTAPRRERGWHGTMRSSEAVELDHGVVPSEVRPRSSLPRHSDLRYHRIPIESVGDGGGILVLRLGLDGDDLEDQCAGVQQFCADHGEQGRRRGAWGPTGAIGIPKID